MGGGLLQIAANSSVDPIFNDSNFTLFLAVYHTYTPFSIQDYTLKLSSLSDFGKKMDITIPKMGDLLTDMVLTVELPEVVGEYIFTNQTDYLNSLKNQYTFSIMNNIEQYNENLYKLNLGNNISAYLVRDSQIGKYQLMLPLLDATMFLTSGKTQKYDLSSFLANNSQFFDNQYNLHVIQNLAYGLNNSITNIDYLNYAFQDKEFYFFIANLLNIKQIDPSYQITYYSDWETKYYNTVKKYILRRPELVALNTFIENMNTQISNSIQINDYVFNYPSIFSLPPLDYQYEISIPITVSGNYFVPYMQFETTTNNKNYLIDSTASFFSIFNKRYILVKRNGAIIGAANINQIIDINPLRFILRPFKHIFSNNLLNNNNYQLFFYYGFSKYQCEPKNLAVIQSYKLNINQIHEFVLDRSIEINIGSTIIIGINSTELPHNNYNGMYGIFIVNQVRKAFNTVDQFTDSGYNTILSASPLEFTQILSTDTLLINTTTPITTNTFYTNYNTTYAATQTTDQLVELIKQNIYVDVSISSLIETPINSISQNLLNQVINSTDFLLTSDIIPILKNNMTTYISDSYDVLFNYLTKIYYKTIIKSTSNQDYLNNIYYKVNYTNTNNLFSFIGSGITTFSNLIDGAFRYQTYLNSIINIQTTNDGTYVAPLPYTNFLTAYIINQYQTFSIEYNNNWSASLLNISQNYSDTFVKIINYLQTNLRTKIIYYTDAFTFSNSDLTNLTITFNKKNFTLTNISDYYSVTYTIPLNIVTCNNLNDSFIIDTTALVASIQDSFNVQNIDLSTIVFTYTTNTTTGVLNVINIDTYLDNYTTNLIPIINDNTSFTTQLYGNNILLDYINTQNDVMFGLMKNYEISRKAISRNGGTKYSQYQEDIIDQTPLLEDNTYLLKFLSEQYYPRFLYSKQLQLYQNIYQKVNELSQNFSTEPSSIYFMNNINYERTDGYNYLNNSQGSIPYLDPNQIPSIINSPEYSYTLLDIISKHNIVTTPQSFSFMRYLEELEEHNNSFEQKSYLQTYWNTLLSQSNTQTNINNYFSALSGKDDALLIYYIYKYLSELLCQWGDLYNFPVNLDQTYFQTIYQLSPQTFGTLLYNTYLYVMKTTVFGSEDAYSLYQTYNSIIQGSEELYTVHSYYSKLPEYLIINNINFNTESNNLLQEISYVFQVTSRLLSKYKINVVQVKDLPLSNYPIVNSIHGSGKLVKIILATEQYTINITNTNFTSSMVFPTGYYVSDYYKLFNLSIHYDFQKYLFLAGYGGILRDTQYPNKTLTSFYQKINNYIVTNVNTVDFAFFSANQSGSYLPNMEGHIVQSYQAWIQRSAQPYFYYYNLLSQFYDMMYIYSGRSFISEYYTDKPNTTLYNNRPDVIQGSQIYANRVAFGTRDMIGRYNGIGKRYNFLDQRLYGIDNNFSNITTGSYNTNQDPIQIINILNTLNQRFTDYQEFLVLIKNSMNIIEPYPNTDNYSGLLNIFKVNSINMFDLDVFNNWNTFLLNYYSTYNYKFSSIITGFSNTISLYNSLSSSTLDMSSLGYELYSFINNFNSINQRNFTDAILLRYANATLYHHLIDELNTSLSNIISFSDKISFNNDVLYWNTNYSLVSLDFLDISLNELTGPYQSDISLFKQLFTSILTYRQKNVSITAQTDQEIKLYNDYYSINDVTSLTFYDKFFKFNSNIDYNLIPLIYHDVYNIQNASHTVVFYLNYLYSFLNNTSTKPNIKDFDDPTLPVSYYFPKYLSSGIDYFLANFHQLKFNSNAFYPYKSVPANVTLYNGTTVPRPKSFMYVFLLMKIQYRNYFYSNVGSAYIYIDRFDPNNNPVRQIIGLNTYNSYPDINNDVTIFDSLIDSIAISGVIDHLQTINHPFFVNKHIDNLLFIKDLLNDISTVPDNASINTVLTNNNNYVEFLSERTIVTNAFDNTGLIFGQYPYTLGVLSEYNMMGFIPIITPNATFVNAYIEGNIVLPNLITKIYYFLISECFILNQTELIGSSFQNTPIALGNILGQITALEWKSGLINLIAEYLFLLLKSKKIIYQNSTYEISYNDIYRRLKVDTGTDRLNDLIDMFINSILNIKISSYEVINNNVPITKYVYLSEYEQFKIPSIFSLVNIKKNFNYSQYYRLIFGLRQSLIGPYNNFTERVQFHNAYDYWKVNNNVLISDYTVITFNSKQYMIRSSEKSSILFGLNYYLTNKTNIPTNLFTTIIDYIVLNIQNSITPAITPKYNFKSFDFVKSGYNVTLTLYNVYFTTSTELYNVSINTGSKTISAVASEGSNVIPFNISFNNLPFGYQYDFVNDALLYQQLLYQPDIVNVLEKMFTLFKNVQNINQSLSILASYSNTNTSQFDFIYFSTFIESFIYYDFTSQVNPSVRVNPVFLPSTAPLGVSTVYAVELINWSEFYGQFFYVYLGINPTASNLLATGAIQFINGIYRSSISMILNNVGRQYISVTNALIDATHPFGSSSVAVNVITPITVSSISDGSIDNNYAIIKVPRSFIITLFGWKSTITITQLYVFFSLTSDGENLQNAAGVADASDGPFVVESYFLPGSNVLTYSINATVTFLTAESVFLYISDVNNVNNFNTAQIFALIPNINSAETIDIVPDINAQSKVCQINNYTGFLTVPKQYIISLPFWSDEYRITQLYVYTADNVNGLNLGNDVEQINVPITLGTIIKNNNNYFLSFTAGFKNLGNNYIYLTYNQISFNTPYGSSPVNFIVNELNPIVTTRIENVTAIANQYIGIINQPTTYTITLGNWQNIYTTDGVTKLYIYTKPVNLPNVYTNYTPINNLPNQTYDIVNNALTFTTTFGNISQLNVYLTYNQISSIYNFGEGLVNIQLSNPPGSLTVFNYIDVINPFSTTYTANTLTTFTTNTILIQVNNFSPNYNIYLTVPNQLYLFLGSTNNPSSIYTSGTPIVFDINFILTYVLYTESIVPVYVFLSDKSTFGTGLIAYGAGSLNNVIGPVNSILNIPTYVIIDKPREFLITLTNWDASYASVDNITNLVVYIGPDINTIIQNLGIINITKPDNYVLNFSPTVSAIANTYNLYIQNNTYLKQQVTNSLPVLNQIYIASLIPATQPVPTFTFINYTGTLGNWNALFPTQLNLFTGQVINGTTPVLSIVDIDEFGNFSFTVKVSQYNFTSFAFSDATQYGTGYVESGNFSINTVIGPINGNFDNQKYVINSVSTNYSILLENWDPSYNVNSVYVYFVDNSNNLLWNYGSRAVSIVNNKYYLKYSDTITGISTGSYTIYISNTNYGITSGNIFLQQLTTPIYVVLQIQLSNVDTDPTPFATYNSTLFTGQIINWIADAFPANMYLSYYLRSDNSYNTALVTVNNTGLFTYTTVITTLPGIIVGISDNITYGQGYIETNQLTLNNIIGPVNANLTTNPYAIFNKSQTYNIILTNWNTSYVITNLYIYLGSNINTLVYSYGLQTIQNDGTNYYINFTNTINGIPQNIYNIYLSDKDPSTIITPNVNQFISNFSIANNIIISSVTPNPTPLQTYTSTVFTGNITNWVSLYPSTIQLYYTISSTGNTIRVPITINVIDSTFTYTNSVNTLPGVTFALSDSNTFGNGYLESNIYSLNSLIGPINAALTTRNYAIFNKNTSYNIVLTNWNSTYLISNLYIYLGSDINTVINSFGSQTIQFNGTNYYINFSSTITGITQGAYNLYLSDQDPSGIITPSINQLITNFNVANNILIASITPDPIPFVTYTSTTFNGQLTNWFSNYYPSTLRIFYTVLSSNITTSSSITINTDGTFAYTNTNITLPGITLSLSDANTYGTGYIESDVNAQTALIGPVGATLSSSNFIINKTKNNFTINLNNWNSTYNISNLYVYIKDSITQQSFGIKSIYLDTDSIYKIKFNITPTLAIGAYSLYISDTAPNTISYVIRQSIATVNIINQISIDSITPVGTFYTYQNTVFNGVINNWNASFYSTPMYVTYYSSYDNVYYNQSITITPSGNTGLFSFTYNQIYISNFNIYVTDNVNLVFGNGYIESSVNTIPGTSISIGNPNALFTNPFIIRSNTSALNITLTSWNPSYGINSLYIYIGSNITTPIQSFGLCTIINNAITITNVSLTLPIGTYTLYLCNANPTLVPFPANRVNYMINNNLNLVNQISINSLVTNPSPVSTYTSTNYSGSLNNWLPSLFPPTMNVSFIRNTIPSISISNTGTFNFTSPNSITYPNDTIKFIDNASYLQTPTNSFPTIIGDVNGVTAPSVYNINTSTIYVITLTNWNSSYGINPLYIFSATNLTFTNLTLITSVTINFSSNIYTATFSTTFSTIGPYYFVISDVLNPISNPFKVFQTIANPVVYADITFTPIVFQTPTNLINPTSIANLLSWYDANEIDGTYLNQPNNNGAITTWRNKIGLTNYNLSTVNGTALYTTSGISNLNSISVTNTGFRATIPAGTFTNTGLTVFIVYKNINSTRATVPLFYRTLVGTNNAWPIEIYNTSRVFANGAGTSVTIPSTHDISASNPSTIFHFNLGTNFIYNEHTNGTQIINNVNSTYYLDSGNQISIGIDGLNSANTGLAGNISEILIFNRVLNTTDYQTIEGYLAWKWNLVTSLPSMHPYSYLNLSFTPPVNTYIGLSTPYEIILDGYVSNPNVTSFFIRYNTNITNPTGLVLVGNVPIIQDELNNYVLRFDTQFPNANTYYFYITDSVGNIYRSIAKPIVVTDASTLITLSAPTSNTNTFVPITLNGWSSLFGINSLSIYYSTIPNDPNPILLTRSDIKYSYNTYTVSFLATFSGNLYFTLIGVNNGVSVFNKSINIIINNSNALFPSLTKYTNYIFKPDSIDSLTLWLDANTVSGSYINQPNNNDDVPTWFDKSGNGYDAVANQGTPYYVASGINQLPCIRLSSGNNYVCNIPTSTFDDGMTIFVVYQNVSSPAGNGALITRTNGTYPDPFDMNTTQRIIGANTNNITISSPVNITTNIIPSIFYANMDAINLNYKESNQFINVLNTEFLYWDDTTNNNNLYIGTKDSLNTIFNGNISEILIFNQPITKLQQYQIEGYLAYKWNLQIYLPLYHPFTPLQSQTFTPLLIDTLCLWMDASNGSSYVVNLSTINQWNDVSYYKNVANRNTNLGPIIVDSQNDLPAFIFNSSSMNFVNTRLLSNRKDVTLMFLIYNSGIASNSPFQNASRPELFPDSSGNIYTSFGISYTNIGTLPTGWVIYTVVANSVSNVTNFYINGVNIYSSTYNSTYISDVSGWSIGPMTATLTEMLVFDDALASNTRILMEGYLANKWGVTDLLPISSPYVNVAPTLNDYNNLIQGQLQLNLDASNNSNFTFSGSNILTWSDSSGNSNSLTTDYGNPILQTNSANTLQGVYFNYASMRPTNLSNMVINSNNVSIFVIGYINNTDGRTIPTLLSTDQKTAIYDFFIGQNTNFNNQMAITYLNGPTTEYELNALLSGKLSNGIQNMNINSSTLTNSVYINGNSINTANNIITGNTYISNFYIGGIQTNTQTFLQSSYIHQVLVYNVSLDDVSRYIIEGQLASKWLIPTPNAIANLNIINTYTAVNTYITILLQNWTLLQTTIYVGYNTDPNSLTGLIIIGSYTITRLNNIPFIKFTYIFPTVGTYYIHLVNQSNVQYASISKQVIVNDLGISARQSLPDPFIIFENEAYNITLNNWSDLVNQIGSYSMQITNFNLYISASNTDPSPTFISNVLIQYSNFQYSITIPALIGANNKYLYLQTTINSTTINLTPILINSYNVTLSCSPTSGLINTSIAFQLSINNAPLFYTLYPTVYLYYATLPNLTSGVILINSFSLTSSNTISFNFTSNQPTIYFYMSTGSNFTGYTFYTGPITFSIPVIIILDSIDLNTNTRNVILPESFSLSTASILAGPNSNYTEQSLIVTENVVQFIPSNISGLNIWLDASSSNNFILSGSLITQWTDNSGNNNNATNPDTFYPTYDNVNFGVDFTGGMYLYMPDGTIPYDDDNYHIFIVLTPSDSTSGPQTIMSSVDQVPPSTNKANSIFTNNNQYVQSWNNGSDLNSNYVVNTKQLVSFEYISSVNRTTYINGVSSGTDVPPVRASTKNYNLLGGLYQNNTFTNLVHEILIYKNTLTVNQRIEIQQYLGNKWLIYVT